MDKVSLKISISPRDFRLLKYLLPHQLKIWHGQVDEVLIVFDYHGYDTGPYKKQISQITEFICDLERTYPKVCLVAVDYSDEAKAEVSRAYFDNKTVPEKTHRYGPYYSYFYGLYHTKYDYVMNLDCDLFFGGNNPNWTKEAIALMKSDASVITCSPLPGPPTADGKLVTQEGQMDDSELRKVLFDSFSTRIFFVYKPSFISQLCPMPIEVAELSSLVRAVAKRKPIWALPEDILTNTMRRKQLKRADFLGTGEGLWSLHPPFRNEEFFEKLPELVRRIETGDIPEAQRGDYDVNDSMVNWDDAWEELKNASMKRKIYSAIGIKKP